MLLLLLAMLALTAAAHAETVTFDHEGITYASDDGATCLITGLSAGSALCPADSVASYGGTDYRITGLSIGSASVDVETITRIDLSACTCIESLPAGAFQAVTRLEECVLPPTLRSLGGAAFLGLRRLRSVTMACPALTTIPTGCFYGCSSLDHVVTLASSIQYDAGFCFSGCLELRYLIMSGDQSAYAGFTVSYTTGSTGPVRLERHVCTLPPACGGGQATLLVRSDAYLPEAYDALSAVWPGAEGLPAYDEAEGTWTLDPYVLADDADYAPPAERFALPAERTVVRRIVYHRSHTAGCLSSVCLPFDWHVPPTCAVLECVGVEGDSALLSPMALMGGVLPAGTPCFVYAPAGWQVDETAADGAGLDLTSTVVPRPAGDGWAMLGALAEALVGAGCLKLDADGHTLGRTTDRGRVYPYRAYLAPADVSPEPSAGVRRVALRVVAGMDFDPEAVVLPTRR